MSDFGNVASTYVKGSFIIFVGNVVSFFILALGSIIVARILTPAEYGLYAVSLILPEFFILFCDWGIGPALTRYISKYKAEGKTLEIWRLIREGLLFRAIIGCFVSLVLFVFADPLSALMLGRPGMGGLVRTASFLILFIALHSTVVAIFNGMMKMNVMATLSILEAVIKGFLSPLLVIMGFGVFGAIIGYITAYIISSILGIFIIIFSRSESISLVNESRVQPGSLFQMLRFGIPLFLASLAVGFSTRLNYLFLSWFVSDDKIGNYYVALNFQKLLETLFSTILVTLLPVFSKINYVSEPAKAMNAFKNVVKLLTIAIIPIIFLVSMVSEPLIFSLFTSNYRDAPLFLMLVLIPSLTIGFGGLTLSSFFKSQDDTRILMKSGLALAVVSSLLTLIFVQTWGVAGFLIASIVAYLSANIIELYYLNKQYRFHPNFTYTLKVLVCATISSGISYFLISLLSNIPTLFSLVLSSVIFFFLYLILCPIIRVLNYQDLKNYEILLMNLPIIPFFIKPLIRFENKILNLVTK